MSSTSWHRNVTKIIVGLGVVGMALGAVCVGRRTVDPFDGKAASEIRADNKLGTRFVWCPAGTFLMGSPNGDPFSDSDEHPQSSVTISHGFWIGKNEVTQFEFEGMMRTNPSGHRRGGALEKSLDEAVLDGMSSHLPAESMSWEDAMIFCFRLTLFERAAGRLPANWEYTLPTEAQWEYACRAGTTTRFAFGETLSLDDANAYSWVASGRAWKLFDKALRRPAKVGSYRPNPWGIHDMHGNVAEWCRDHFQPQLVGGLDPYVDTSRDNERTIRGGSYFDVLQVNQQWPLGARSANRSGNGIAVFNKEGGPAYLGFRVAISRVREPQAGK